MCALQASMRQLGFETRQLTKQCFNYNFIIYKKPSHVLPNFILKTFFKLIILHNSVLNMGKLWSRREKMIILKKTVKTNYYSCITYVFPYSAQALQVRHIEFYFQKNLVVTRYIFFLGWITVSLLNQNTQTYTYCQKVRLRTRLRRCQMKLAQILDQLSVSRGFIPTSAKHPECLQSNSTWTTAVL